MIFPTLRCPAARDARLFLGLVGSILSLDLLPFAPVASAQPIDPADRMIIETDVMVETRYGFAVAANVYRPADGERHPVIVSMGPYGKDALPAEYGGIFDNGQIVVSAHAAFETPDPEYWVHHGYAVIAADSPGSGRSGGDLDLFGTTESYAYYDLIEWAAAQSWSNGRVGLGGVSYFGVVQWYVAALAPPHLAAIMPGEALTDFYRDAVTQGGIPSDFGPLWWEHRILPAKTATAGVVRNFATALAEHPFADAFWSGWLPDLAAITVPAYVIASWPDHGLHTRGTLLGFEGIASEDKWLEVHGRKKWEHYYSRESLERQRRFFDRFLRGIDNGMDDVPRVRYERRRRFYDGEIVYADTWPLPTARATPYYLTGSAHLSVAPSLAPAVLEYDSSASVGLELELTFAETTEITGPAALTVWVEAPSATDMDLFVGLAKRDRHGREVYMPGYNDVENGHLASGWLRVSHRALDEARSNTLRPFLRHDAALALRPGEPVEAVVEILPSSTLFFAGESLVLRIAGVELAGAGGITHLDPVNGGVQRIHVGGDYPSRLTLPIVTARAR